MLSVESYTYAAILFPKLLGAIFFFAFSAFLFQIKGLIGKNGILPIAKYLDWIQIRFQKKCYRIAPTLFWLNCTDNALMAVTYLGCFLSILLMLGVYPPIILFFIYILYLSIVVAGQDFLSFGWEGFLLEITINTFFLTLTDSPNLMIWISLNLLLFRFHFQGGTVKLQSGDPNWRNLTGVAYHYQSQPIPNKNAWYAHKLPMGFQKLSTLLMLIIEIVIPFGIFGSETMRLATYFCLVGLQLLIWLTGNFSYLNHLTIAFCTILLANDYVPELLRFAPLMIVKSPIWIDVLCSVVGTFLVAFQAIVLWCQFFPISFLSSWINTLSRYHIVNRYGIFAVMTTDRYEVVFEGSLDGKNWKEYTFYYKPSDITSSPKRISPFQPRLDWQVWFLPFEGYRYDDWLLEFMQCLLKGEPQVLKLLKGNPFPDQPPKYIRSLLYEYTFSSKAEKKEFGWWWKRKFIRVFTRPISFG